MSVCLSVCLHRHFSWPRAQRHALVLAAAPVVDPARLEGVAAVVKGGNLLLDRLQNVLQQWAVSADSAGYYWR